MSVQPSHLVKELTIAFERERNSELAEPMRAYMRDQFDFLGIKSPERKSIHKAVIENVGYSTDVLAVAELLWKKREREYQYSACELLTAVVKSKRLRPLLAATDESISRIEKLITTKSWWDTVDALAPRVAYQLLLNMKPGAIRANAKRWAASDNMWLNRSAMILQLGARNATDFELMKEVILQHASSPEFFLRKGAGWALREYSKYQPERVRVFVEKHKKLLSPLTVREATKYT